MHDKNGLPLSNGDYVAFDVWIDGKPVRSVGKILSSNPGTETCNLYLGIIVPSFRMQEMWDTASKVEKVPL